MSRTFYCPAPLVYAKPPDNDDYYILWALERAECALPCPTLTYTSEEWKLLIKILLGVTSTCLVAAVVSTLILSTRSNKFYNKIMFTCGFLTISIVTLIFLTLNYDNSVICREEAYFYRREPFCVFQAAMMNFFFLWIQIWGVFLSLETSILLLSKKKQKMIRSFRQYYTRIAVIVPSILVTIPLANGNLGFDPYANLPICLFLFHDNRYYFWIGLYAPFLMLNVICSIITIVSIVRIHRIFVSVNEMTTNPDNLSRVNSPNLPVFARESSISVEDSSDISGLDNSVLRSSLVSDFTL